MYCTKTSGNIFLILGQIFSLLAVVKYVSYLVDSDRIHFTINTNDDSLFLIRQFASFSESMTTYSDVISILIFISFIRILFYLRFSYSLSLVLDVIVNANLDIFFFLIIFSILLIAFSLISIVLFGSSTP